MSLLIARHTSVQRTARSRVAVVATVLAALASLACDPQTASTPPAQPSITTDTAHHAAQDDSSLSFPYLPDPAKTPGATLDVTAADICVPGYAKKVRNVPAAVKRQVYASYGIWTHNPGDYEIDHLISLELGGSNSVRNLWPQSYRTRPWNARVKDALENELHRRVCAGTIDLSKAQQLIASNWVIGYRKYVRPTPPVPGSRSRRPRSARPRRTPEPPVS